MNAQLAERTQRLQQEDLFRQRVRDLTQMYHQTIAPNTARPGVTHLSCHDVMSFLELVLLVVHMAPQVASPRTQGDLHAAAGIVASILQSTNLMELLIQCQRGLQNPARRGRDSEDDLDELNKRFRQLEMPVQQLHAQAQAQGFGRPRDEEEEKVWNGGGKRRR